MPYKRFLSYNIIGAVAWVILVTSMGYFFGNIPIVKDNFSLVVIAIVLISVLPVILNELIRNYRKKDLKQENRWYYQDQ